MGNNEACILAVSISSRGNNYKGEERKFGVGVRGSGERGEGTGEEG